jgi:hypothetical protein
VLLLDELGTSVVAGARLVIDDRQGCRQPFGRPLPFAQCGSDGTDPVGSLVRVPSSGLTWCGAVRLLGVSRYGA